jgi:hypothetical protein
MRLLVSVRDAEEAAAAVAGGADIIDVKNPDEGPLGAQPPRVIKAIVRAVPPEIPVSATIGDCALPGTGALAALGAALCGVKFVKVGLGAAPTEATVRRLLEALRAAIESSGADTGLVACAYADAERVGSIDPVVLPDLAAPFAHGCLIDTALKNGRSLFECLAEPAIARVIQRCRDRGLFVALAGSLRRAELVRARHLGADIVGVRAAACTGGRLGRISREQVMALKAALAGPSPHLHARPQGPPVL